MSVHRAQARDNGKVDGNGPSVLLSCAYPSKDSRQTAVALLQVT